MSNEKLSPGWRELIKKNLFENIDTPLTLKQLDDFMTQLFFKRDKLSFIYYNKKKQEFLKITNTSTEEELNDFLA
jgi:hypothetical protein